MRAFNHSDRTLAKGRMLIGVTAVALSSLILTIGFGMTIVLLCVVAVLALCCAFPRFGSAFISGLIAGLFGYRGGYYGRRYRRRW
jgi:hypothetical protein